MTIDQAETQPSVTVGTSVSPAEASDNLDVEYTIDREALGIFHVTADDDSRPVLSHVAFSKGRAWAADGFMAAEIETPGMPMDRQVLIHRRDLKAIRHRTSPVAPGVALKPQEDGTLVATGAAKPNQPVICEPKDATFPDLDKIFPTKAPQATVALNAELLKKLIAMVGDVADGSALQFRIHDKDTAVEVRTMTYGGRKVRALLMPMILTGGRMAEWFETAVHEEPVTEQDGNEEDEAA